MFGSLNNIAPGNIVKFHVGSRSLLAAIIACGDVDELTHAPADLWACAITLAGDVEQLPQAYVASMACVLA